MVETFPVPIRCPGCKGQLTALVGPVQSAHAPPSVWKCPYCGTIQRTLLGGSVLSVKRRHDITEVAHAD